MPPTTPVVLMRRGADDIIVPVTIPLEVATPTGSPIQAQLVSETAGQVLPLEPTTGALVVADYGTVAAIEGDIVCRWINNITPGAASVVLTNAPAGDQPGIYYNLNPGEIVMITQACIEMMTLNDDVDWELGYTAGANATGAFQPITPIWHYSTGAANQGFDGDRIEVTPPGPISYVSGARSITFRVDCNDAGAEITVTWHGFIVRV